MSTRVLQLAPCPTLTLKPASSFASMNLLHQFSPPSYYKLQPQANSLYHGSGISGGRQSLSPPASAAAAAEQKPFFSNCNKISVISLERRIDYHLQRIMKQNRLINFKNSIEGLPIEDRINESLLEIIASSSNLILRRQSLIQSSLQLLAQLRALYKDGSYDDAFDLLVSSFLNLKHVSSSLGQLIWALNSNKEHVKYVIKVFALPEVYTRFGPDCERIPLKERIMTMIGQCEETMERCQALKNSFHEIIIQIFLAQYHR